MKLKKRDLDSRIQYTIDKLRKEPKIENMRVMLILLLTDIQEEALLISNKLNDISKKVERL